MVAVYAGSFNPIHLGHIDIIKRAVKIFGSVIVIVTNNSSKHYEVSIEDRMSLVQQTIESEMLDSYVEVIRLEEGESVADFCMAEVVDVLVIEEPVIEEPVIEEPVKHTREELEDLKKADIRVIAEELGLDVAKKTKAELIDMLVNYYGIE